MFYAKFSKERSILFPSVVAIDAIERSVIVINAAATRCGFSPHRRQRLLVLARMTLADDLQIGIRDTEAKCVRERGRAGEVPARD